MCANHLRRLISKRYNIAADILQLSPCPCDGDQVFSTLEYEVLCKFEHFLNICDLKRNYWHKYIWMYIYMAFIAAI